MVKTKCILTLLAEFIVDLHYKSKDYDSFKQSLAEVGADFPESFVVNLDRLIQTLKPKQKETVPSESAEGSGADAKAKKFPGLAIPDKKAGLFC